MDLTTLIIHADRLAEFEAHVAMIPVADQQLGSLSTHEKELNRLWEAFRLIYDSLLFEASKTKSPQIVEIKSRYMASYNTYVRGISLITNLLDRLKSAAQAQKTIDQGPMMHIPPCDTPVFYGDYKSWPSFRDMFSALYGNNPRLNPVQKLYYLLQKTARDAHDTIKTVPLTNDGYAIAWKKLVETYENKGALINEQLRTLLNIKPITQESGPNIKNLQRTINDCITNLSLLEVTPEIFYHVMLVYICVTKLPENTLSLWEQSKRLVQGSSKWEDMDAFLTAHFKTLDSISDIKQSHSNISHHQNKSLVTVNMRKNFSFNGQKKSSNDVGKIQSFATKTSTSPITCRCFLCQGSHPIRLCPVFLSQNIEERNSTVRRLKCCSNCLATSHDFKNCKSIHVCSLCKQKHHSLLHRDVRSNMSTTSTPHNKVLTSSTSLTTTQNPVISNPNPANIHSQPAINFNPSTSSATQNLHTYSAHLKSNLNPTVLLGSTSCLIHINDIRCATHALVDPGSQASFISRRLQRKLAIPTFSVPSTNVTGMMDCLAGKSSTMCVLTVGSTIDPCFNLKFCAYVVEKITGRLPSCSISNMITSTFPDITMTDVMCTRMDILFGGNVYPKILTTDVKVHPNGNLIAQRTVFGWIVTGEVFQSEPLHSVASFCNHVELNNQLARFWELEEVPPTTQLSESEALCEKLYQATTYRNPDGRYVVTLPFRPEFLNEMSLGNSRKSALSQFIRNEQRLLKNPDLKCQYDQVIKEYFEMGHLRVIETPDANASNYYLPHHAVFKPDSVTTKLRVVFNASNPSSNGISLNNILYPGPILQTDLTILILRWRFFRYVFNADIEKMYRQILIRPDQIHYQRILFRENPVAEIKDYELKTVTFGVNCAPYLAIRTLLQLANDCEPLSPAASEIMKTQMYVDDVLAGSHELEDALKRRNELIEVLGSAGFTLRKWTANHLRLLKDLPNENLLDADFLKISDASMTKTLGLRWNANKDSFYFQLISQPCRDMITKRAVLSEIAKLFDPAGWLSPKIIVAKIIMQQIWKDKTEWDECIKPLTLIQWRTFLNDYPNIEKIHIPRWINFHPENEIEIHAFCDASEKAYGTAIYIRNNEMEKITTHLLASKTKVAPVKCETLPRLELCGAALMANMVESLCIQLNIDKSKIYLWTDSTIVLSWLRKPLCHWPTFVKNRVAAIVTKVGNENWSHVDSKDNPADLASRGALARDLINNSLWWHGPAWLRKPRQCWPRYTHIDHQHLEVQSFVVQNERQFDILERFSDLPRAMRIISYCFRCLQYLKTRKCSYDTLDLTQSEVKFTRDRLVLVCQRNFIPEYTQLSKGIPISPKSNLITLNPFIDSSGFVRINGRLVQSAALKYDEKYPKILPYSARFTRLFVEHVHKYSVHGGHSLMLRLIRTEFWIPKLKNLIRTVIHNCKECTIYRKRSAQQIMAALPPERSSFSRPFTHTGLDFAGPFEIKSYIGRGCRITKGYVLVFVCFATKAIHLEATGDMSTETFLAAFSRFFSRRGCPSHLYSDNGTGFVGAANLLKVDQKQFLAELKRKVLVRNSFQLIEWHFIPPGAPHMGGLWEAGVKSVKTHLRKISGVQKFTYEEFMTMLTRIEACLNSRPLTAMSENPSDIVSLTPGHFLTGGPLLAPAEPDYSELSLSIANRWQKLKILHHQFAQRWKEEYLKELHRRVKWKYPQRDLEVGDLVIIRQDNLPPNEWRLGRIEKTYTGHDSKVRVADVRTTSGTFTRPIMKLVLLPKPDKS